MNFAFAGNAVVNLDELLYIKKCAHKELYVCIFKTGAEINMHIQTGQKQYDNSVLFLTPKEYKKLYKYLKDAQKSSQTQV